jgi:hypothetical protein
MVAPSMHDASQRSGNPTPPKKATSNALPEDPARAALDMEAVQPIVFSRDSGSTNGGDPGGIRRG